MTGPLRDVDRDGFADLVVSQMADYGFRAEGDDAGAAYLIYGGPGLGGESSFAEADFTLWGDREGAGYGTWATAASDFDGDGFGDLAFGAMGDIFEGIGHVYVMPGSDR
jgi:hypothetical protein